ncbi:unnamed protein product [Rotaria magnacalcarata]|uniref:Uncharacterized protein n=1 Tax=Rotaria magnacalcarata TaxID=392030 RepID=A0A8S2ZE77_9BILA|nr:unnamed protein product [Rotaria magnacalcarata]
MPSNLNLTQESYDDEDDIANELNLAVVVGHEDIQSLRAFSTEQTHPENGSLDVAFIDETDVERQKNQVENEQRDQSSAMDIPNNDNETLSQTIVAPGEQQSIEMQDVCQTNDLDEILKRNENRCIRLTDSDNIGVLNGGRESILQLKGELAGRVLRQVRAFEQRSSENIQNRSIVPTSTSTLSLQQKLDDSKTELTSKPSSTILSTLSSLTIMNTPEQNLIEQALRNSNKIISSSNGTGEVTRSVKRLQNTPIRRWRERAREFERRHQITPPYRLLNRKRK